jgi:hypothetical protein
MLKGFSTILLSPSRPSSDPGWPVLDLLLAGHLFLGLFGQTPKSGAARFFLLISPKNLQLNGLIPKTRSLPKSRYL